MMRAGMDVKEKEIVISDDLFFAPELGLEPRTL